MPSDSRRSKSTMRGVYVSGGAGGASAAAWDHACDAIDLGHRALANAREDGPDPASLVERVQTGARVLEAGCGSGRVLAFLRELESQAVGLDFALKACSAGPWGRMPSVCRSLYQAIPISSPPERKPLAMRQRW